MTQPITQEIAEEHGYGPESLFKEWTRKYFDSLDVEKRMNQMMPIQQFILEENENANLVPTLTKELEKYVLDTDGRRYPTLILNPNYIYILKGKGRSSYYVPIEIPFKYKSKMHPNERHTKNMVGIFGGRDYSYTHRGFNTHYSEIIGILKFPQQVEFLNWGIENPFNLK